MISTFSANAWLMLLLPPLGLSPGPPSFTRTQELLRELKVHGFQLLFLCPLSLTLALPWTLAGLDRCWVAEGVG